MRNVSFFSLFGFTKVLAKGKFTVLVGSSFVTQNFYFKNFENPVDKNWITVIPHSSTSRNSFRFNKLILVERTFKWFPQKYSQMRCIFEMRLVYHCCPYRHSTQPIHGFKGHHPLLPPSEPFCFKY